MSEECEMKQLHEELGDLDSWPKNVRKSSVEWLYSVPPDHDVGLADEIIEQASVRVMSDLQEAGFGIILANGTLNHGGKEWTTDAS